MSTDIALQRQIDALEKTLNEVLAPFAGRTQSNSAADMTRLAVHHAVTNVLCRTFRQQDPESLPFRVVCDQTNNTPATIEQGYLQFDVVDRLTGRRLNPEDLFEYQSNPQNTFGGFYTPDPKLQAAIRLLFNPTEEITQEAIRLLFNPTEEITQEAAI